VTIFNDTTVSPHLSAVMEENHDKYKDNGFPGKESNPELPGHQHQLMQILKDSDDGVSQ
jgi:hypothetical protein